MTTPPLEVVSGHADCLIITFKVEQSRSGELRGAFRSASSAGCCVFRARFQTFLPLRADGRAALSRLSSPSNKKPLRHSPQVRDSTRSLANQVHGDSVKRGRHICLPTFALAHSSVRSPRASRLLSSRLRKKTPKTSTTSTTSLLTAAFSLNLLPSSSCRQTGASSSTGLNFRLLPMELIQNVRCALGSPTDSSLNRIRSLANSALVVATAHTGDLIRSNLPPPLFLDPSLPPASSHHAFSLYAGGACGRAVPRTLRGLAV